MGAASLEFNENYEIVCFFGLWLPLQPRREIRSGLALLRAHSPPPPPHQNCYYVLVLRGKHVQQRSANSKVIHQQNEIINVINTCSHTSIFRCLEIGLGEGGLVGGGVRGGGSWTNFSHKWKLPAAWRVRPGIYQDSERLLRCRTKVFRVIWGVDPLTLFNNIVIVAVVRAPVL